MTTAQPRIVFLLDVDNTLLDHDALKRRVTRWVEAHVEGGSAGSFWKIYEEVRGETGIVDFLEAARRFAMAVGSAKLGCEMARFLWAYLIKFGRWRCNVNAGDHKSCYFVTVHFPV